MDRNICVLGIPFCSLRNHTDNLKESRKFKREQKMKGGKDKVRTGNTGCMLSFAKTCLVPAKPVILRS